MEEEKFNELLRSLRALRLSGEKGVDVIQFAGMADITPEQRARLLREFREKKIERTEPVFFEDDYF